MIRRASFLVEVSETVVVIFLNDRQTLMKFKMSILSNSTKSYKGLMHGSCINKAFRISN